MTEQEYVINTISEQEVFTTDKKKINASASRAMEAALKQNQPVGTISGYYDESLSIWAVSSFFLENLGYRYQEFMDAAKGSFSNMICSDPLYPFSRLDFQRSKGVGRLHMRAKNGTSVFLRTVKTESTDNDGRPVWILSAKVEHIAPYEVEEEEDERQATVVDQLIFGISRIVEKFAVCDLEKNSYEYYELGNTQTAHPSGPYQELVQILAKEHIVNSEKQELGIEQLLSIDYIRSTIKSPKDLFAFECSTNTTEEKRAFKVISLVPIEWKNGILRKIMLIVQDVGQKHELETLANTDSLTGLRNERSLSTILRTKIEKKQHFALFFLDLDMFKSVNDTYGHNMGDKLLRAVSQRLLGCIRKSDYAFRIGGDEFALIMTGNAINDIACQKLMDRIKETINSPFHIDDHILRVDTSCGYAICPKCSTSAQELRELADRRMYQDKAAGKQKRYQ